MLVLIENVKNKNFLFNKWGFTGCREGREPAVAEEWGGHRQVGQLPD